VPGRRAFQLAGGFGKSVQGEDVSIFSFGARFPIATLQGFSKGVSFMQLSARAQALYYKYGVGPVAPNVWLTSGVTFRYGGALAIKFGRSKRWGVIVSTDFARVSGNFFLIGQAALSYRF
jgi:hypothetical protein